jgi:hypothetical protein
MVDAATRPHRVPILMFGHTAALVAQALSGARRTATNAIR